MFRVTSVWNPPGSRLGVADFMSFDPGRGTAGSSDYVPRKSFHLVPLGKGEVDSSILSGSTISPLFSLMLGARALVHDWREVDRSGPNRTGTRGEAWGEAHAAFPRPIADWHLTLNTASPPGVSLPWGN